jgi:DNA-binding SARP family transcriptional activator/TolB-like protein
MRIVIHLLGPFRITLEGVPVEEGQWERKKSKTLIKILALQPLRQSARQMHREELIELLWPGVSPEQGLNNLHKALHAARRVLEPALSGGGSSRFLQMRDQLVLLQGADDVSVDVSEFEAMAEEALKTGVRTRIEAALALYEADLLPEDLYEDWTAVRREQLRSQKEQLLSRLAAVCEASGDHAEAADAFQQLIALNSCNEQAHRGLMRVYAAQGQRHLAVQQYRTCAEALRSELEMEPEPATISLYERILAGGTAAHSPTAAATAAVSAEATAANRNKRRPKPWLAAAGVALAGLAVAAWFHAQGNSGAIQSVAIMPLATGADSPQLDYVAEGLTESLIGELSQLRQVRVMARSMVYRYRAQGLDSMAAAAVMNVGAVLTGTISKRADKLALSVELVRVPDGTRLWGAQYSLSDSELISVQDRIASEVAAHLGLRLNSEDHAHLSSPHSTDPEAYRLYVQARFFWNQRSKEGYLKSIELYEAAIARDPTYARAYAGLSDSYSFLGRDEAPTHEYLQKARAAAERALSLDEKLAEAHATLAMMGNVYDWNFPEAERQFRRALDLDPAYPTTHLFYGVFLVARGRLDEAQSQLDQASRLDPLSPIIALCRGYPESFRGHLEPAVKAAREALELSPNYPAALEDLMVYSERQGRQDEAMQHAVALLHARGQHELAETVQRVSKRSGYPAAVRTWLEAEEKRSARMYVSPLRLGQLAMRAGDLDKAFAWLNKATEERNAGLVYLGTDPKYQRLRQDPRYVTLCARVGVKPAAP